MGEFAGLLNFKKDLACHIAIMHLLALLVLLRCVLLGDFFKSVELDNGCLEGAS